MAMGFRSTLADANRRRYAILLMVAAILVIKVSLHLALQFHINPQQPDMSSQDPQPCACR